MWKVIYKIWGWCFLSPNHSCFTKEPLLMRNVFNSWDENLSWGFFFSFLFAAQRSSVSTFFTACLFCLEDPEHIPQGRFLYPSSFYGMWKLLLICITRIGPHIWDIRHGDFKMVIWTCPYTLWCWKRCYCLSSWKHYCTGVNRLASGWVTVVPRSEPEPRIEMNLV